MNSYINISIQQPSIPTYRRDLFEKLNKRVRLSLYYGDDGVPSDLPDKITKFYYPLKVYKISKIFLKWHSAQLKAVNKETDVAFLSWDIQYLTLWLALMKSFFLRKPVILWGHGYSKNERKLKQYIRNIPAFFSAGILLYDYHTADNLKKINILKSKVFVAPNSIEQIDIKEATEYYRNNKEKLNEFQLNQELSESFNLIYIGRIYKENRLDHLIDALKFLKRESFKIKLIIIGKENDYVEQLKLKAKEFKVDHSIIWAGEIYDEKKIAPWMLSSHVFCYPENLGLSIMHAFGYGLPVITDDAYHRHNPEIWAFTSGVNGLSYKSDNSKDLSDQIIKLYKNKKLRKELSNNAMLTVTKTFTIENMVEGFLDSISFVLSK